MSECRYCGRVAMPDRETGYDADDCCPACADRVCEHCQHELRSKGDTTGLCPCCLDEREARRRDEYELHRADPRR